MSTPYERLMAEALPTGPFAPALPPRQQKTRLRPWTPQEQAQHVTDLLAALDGWQDPSERAEQKRVRHLRLVHDQGQQPNVA